GETAEHPGLLAQDEYDVAGAVTGVVEAGQILGPNGYVTAMSLLPWSLPGRIPTAIRSYVQLWPHSIGSGMTTLQNSDGHWAKSCWNPHGSMPKPVWDSSTISTTTATSLSAGSLASPAVVWLQIWPVSYRKG